MEILKAEIPKAFILEPSPEEYDSVEEEKLKARNVTPGLTEFLNDLIDEVEGDGSLEVLGEAPEQLGGKLNMPKIKEWDKDKRKKRRTK